MGTRVIVPPSPLLTPAEVPGAHAADDAKIALIIAAAQEEIDGPEGWLGRSLGVQTLETTALGFNWSVLRLPYPPIVDVVSVQYFDGDVLQPVSASFYDWRDDEIYLKPGYTWPSVVTRENAVRIRYRAGYDGVGVEQGGTGAVPQRAKHAITLAVLHAMSIGAENLFVRSEEVEGVGTTTYTISTVARDLIQGAIDRSLQGLRLYS